MMLGKLPDPRLFAPLSGENNEKNAPPMLWWNWADQAMQASTQLEAQDYQRRITADWRASWQNFSESYRSTLTRAVYQAPSIALRKYLWRLLNEFLQGIDKEELGEALSFQVFALPIPIIAAAEEVATLHTILPDVTTIRSFLLTHQVLQGNLNFALAPQLCGVSWLTLPKLLTWLPNPEQAPSDQVLAPISWPDEPCNLGQMEQVFLRFLVGVMPISAKTASSLWQNHQISAWGMPFCQLLNEELAKNVVPIRSEKKSFSLLTLPRQPMSPLIAGYTGRLLQREAAAQLFISNALRKFRASVGEPTAILAAHRLAVDDADTADSGGGDGEIRMTLSSPFAPKETEAFSWPLDPLDRINDIEQLLLNILRDCQLGDYRVLTEVYPDLNPDSGKRLFLKLNSAEIGKNFMGVLN